MSVVKIALGVFLGNLAFALLAWLVLGVAMQGAHTSSLIDQANGEYNAMQARPTPSNSHSTP